MTDTPTPPPFRRRESDGLRDTGNGVLVPVPDPTTLTTALIERAIAGEHSYIVGQVQVLEERLHGIDRATELLATSVGKVPNDITTNITHVRELVVEKFDALAGQTDERFRSIAQQFAERDTRSERESRDNKVAVDAAFAAQKEAAAKQDEGNLKAIDKSEKATAETITKLSELFASTTDGLADKIEGLKERSVLSERLLLDRIAALEVRIGGAEQNKVGGREASTGIYAFAGFILVLLSIVAAVVALKG